MLLTTNLTGCINITVDGNKANELQVSDLVIASKVDENTYEVLEEVDAFQVDSPTINVVAKISGAKEDETVVKVQWFYVDKNTFIDSAEAIVGYNEGPLWFSLSRPNNGWPTGQYMVKIFADDIKLAVKTFDVK